MREHRMECAGGFGLRLALSIALAAAPVVGGNRHAFAQVPGTAALQTGGDPPARVGRVARISGTVSFHSADADHWEPATLNFPVTSGDAFWTQPGAAADLDLGGARIRLDQRTEFTVDTLDDQHITVTAQQGHLAIDLRELPQGETATLRTPRGIVTFREAGRYAVQVGDTQRPTIVSVNQGAAYIEGPGVALPLSAHQAAEINGTDPFTAIQVAEAPDALISAFVSLDRPAVSPSSLGPPPAVLQMTGYEAIADTGSWEQAPDYGRVWYPPVDRDWVPYRQGRWSYVQPWGWTWVDDAPWGFAPSHYGRWVEIDNRWAWTPEDREAAYVGRPVYAPALVSFVGVAAGVALGVGIGAAVGWIPLGPREAYRPPYRVSEGYGRRVNAGAININRTNIVNNTTNVSNTTINRFVNNRATTVVPAVAMQQSLPVAQRLVPQAQVQPASFRPVAQPGVQPSLSTRGITPAAAQALRLPGGANAGTPLPAAPGPSFRQGAGRPGAGSSAGVGGARVPTNAPAGSGAQVQSVPGRVGALSAAPIAPGPGMIAPAAPGPGGRPGAAAPQLAPGPAIPTRTPGQGGSQLRPFEPLAAGPRTPAGLPGDRAAGRVTPGIPLAPGPVIGPVPQRPQVQMAPNPGSMGSAGGFNPGLRPGPQPWPETRPQNMPQAPRPALQPTQAPRHQPQLVPQAPRPQPQAQPQLIPQAPRPQPAFQAPRPQPQQAPPQPQMQPQAFRPQPQPMPQAPRPPPQAAPQVAHPQPAPHAAPGKACPPGRLTC